MKRAIGFIAAASFAAGCQPSSEPSADLPAQSELAGKQAVAAPKPAGDFPESPTSKSGVDSTNQVVQVTGAAEAANVPTDTPQADSKPPSASGLVSSNDLGKKGGVWLTPGTDQPYTGPVVDRHENGKRSMEGQFTDGKQSGQWSYYHENGGQFRTGNYMDGKPDGLWTYWHENDTKRAEIQYRKGQLHGSEVRWHENGMKKTEAVWDSGRKVSEEKWDTQGNPLP